MTFSGLTIAAALASLLIFPQRFLYSVGLGGVLVTLGPLATSLIALPALLVNAGFGALEAPTRTRASPSLQLGVLSHQVGERLEPIGIGLHHARVPS